MPLGPTLTCFRCIFCHHLISFFKKNGTQYWITLAMMYCVRAHAMRHSEMWLAKPKVKIGCHKLKEKLLPSFMIELPFETRKKKLKELKITQERKLRIWYSLAFSLNNKCYKVYLTSICRNIIVLLKKKVCKKHPHIGETLLTFFLIFMFE